MTAEHCVVIALIIIVGLIIIRALDLFGVDKREASAFKVVLEKLISNPRIRRESLIEIVEDQLVKQNPEVAADWRYDINNQINLMKERGWISEIEGFLIFRRP